MRAVTLVELLVALAIAGLLAGIAVPRAAALRDRLVVEREASRLVDGYRRARHAAGMAQQPARLVVQSDTLRLYLLASGPSGADSSLVWRAAGPAAAGVAMQGAPQAVLFAPSGITLGAANQRYVVEKGGISRAVIASRLGRLRIER